MQSRVAKGQLVNDVRDTQEHLEQQAEVNLKQLWAEAKEKFSSITKLELGDDPDFSVQIGRQVETILTVDDPRDSQADVQEEHQFFSKEYLKKGFRRAKNLFQTIFQVIWKFSDFLMPMAQSIPFVGSGVTLLTKAIEILITTTQDYQAIFTKAAEVFEQVGFFSMRFEMLIEAETAGAKVHHKFVQFLNVILAHSIECVALFVRLTQESVPAARGTSDRVKHITRVTKQFFLVMGTNDDRGVGASLAKLRALVEEEGKLSSALILATVLKIHTDVVAVRGGVNTMTGQLETMRDMLEEQGNLLGPSKADQLKKMLCITDESWRSRLRSYSERRIPGTGEWLLHHEMLMAWISDSAESRQVLAIEADSNSGKTYLAVAAIAHLRKREQENQTPANVAFCLFDTSSKKLTFGDVVRAISYQLCLQDLRFFDCAFPEIQSISEGPDTVSGVDLWRRIIVDIAIRTSESICYVVLDGLNFLDERDLASLGEALAVSSTATESLRILITGDAASLTTITRRYSQTLCSITLSSSYPNRRDVALVAEAHLADCGIFLGEERGTELLEYKADVCDRLVQITSGDYYILLSRIGDIRRVLSSDEVETVLNRTYERRHDAIAHNLSSLATRLSKGEVFQLRETLHLLSVLSRLGAAMPHLSVVERYLRSLGATPNLTKASIESVFPSLLALDDQENLALSTDDIAAYIIPALENGEALHTLSPPSHKGQLRAIQHVLAATFTPQTLETHGFDEAFFKAKMRHIDLSRFTTESDTAMANTIIHLVGCLADKQKLSIYQTQQLDAIATLAREVLPAVLLQHDLNTLSEHTRVNFGVSLARLFLEDDLLETFLPVEVLSLARDTWGSKLEFFEVVHRFIKHPGVVERLEQEYQEHPWTVTLQHICTANELKAAISKIVAKRWLQSKSFWTYEDIRLMLSWFTIMPELELEEKNVIIDGYDQYRTRGWFTPPNWEKIVKWAVENIHIAVQAELEIQTAAVLCAFGDTSGKSQELVHGYRATDWRATFWLAEATSHHDGEEAYSIVEQCLDLIAEQRPHQEVVKKAIDFVLSFVGSWPNISRNMDLRVKMIELDKKMPGILSFEMISFSMEIAIRVKREAGFEFFKSLYESRKDFVIDTFVHRGSTNNFMHIAFSRALAKDTDDTRMVILSDAYRNAIAQCKVKETLSRRQMHVARLRLGFWYGRLYFLHCKDSEPNAAIRIWEDILEDFFKNPSVADVEIVLPITTHLCSAYIQRVLKDTASPEADSIISKVENMYEIARFSQDALTLKLRFRLGLCLARLHMVRNHTTKAREVLCEHAVSAFAMIDQYNNAPLASIGWFYLASILTMLSHERAMWCWGGVQPHQPDRWSSSWKYNEYSKTSDNPPLEEDLRSKLDAIKRGEEYVFYDGNHVNNIHGYFPDDSYLPTYASMACEGRQCNSTSDDRSAAFDTYCKPLHVPAEWPHSGGTFTPAQKRYWKFGKIFGRVPYWVCKDCMLSKLCTTCSSSLERGELTPMGCDMSHDGILVPASYGQNYPYTMTDEDWEILGEVRAHLMPAL
ncbi:hypothetical protein ACN47E_010079 [Coniothyrium glycines]